jgi:hypothetical protein
MQHTPELHVLTWTSTSDAAWSAFLFNVQPTWVCFNPHGHFGNVA